jgi:NAD+ synthase
MTASCLQKGPFGPASLIIDPAAEVERIVNALRAQVGGVLHKRGLVLGLSGGVDSSVSVALAVRAVGAKNVFALFMPECDSDPESLQLGRLVADTFGVSTSVEDIGPILEAMGCYRRREDAIRAVLPAYGADWKSKLVIADAKTAKGYALTSLVAQSPDDTLHRLGLPPTVYLAIVAATNMKQRTRKLIEYTHADRLNYAVLGTPNRLEYDQGFFVKNGDGAADVKPIAHLYKSQVYQLAEYLGVPTEIRARPPTTDTFSMPQTQEEFYFSLPWNLMDLCLYGLNHAIPIVEIAAATGLATEVVERVLADIASKRRATAALHMPPLLVEPVMEIEKGPRGEAVRS